MPTFTLRAMTPEDGPALRVLMENDPDTPGMSSVMSSVMSSTTKFLRDPYQAWAALKPEFAGVVAEVPGVEGLVGCATASFEDVQIGGQVLPSAFLENLKVHHEHRGAGMGTALAQWRIDEAHRRYGSECAILTGTSVDNTASLATMRKWARQFVGPMRVFPRPGLIAPPALPPGTQIRPARREDWPAIAAKSNHFYRDYNFYSPLTVEKMEALFGTEGVYGYTVAQSANGELLAGALLSERAALMVDEFRNVPMPLRFLNRVLHVLPADFKLRLLEVDGLWFESLPAGRAVWETIRYEYRERASSFSLTYDPRSPLVDVLRPKPWHLPKIDITIALHAPVTLSADTLLCSTSRG